MRLTPDQIHVILDTATQLAGPSVKVWLYGSRLDDHRRGGDVDLLVESTPQLPLLERARLKYRLEQRLGLPVDILTPPQGANSSPFVAIARAQAQPL